MSIALSLGHWGKTSRPRDRGAMGVGPHGEVVVEAWEALPLLTSVALGIEKARHEALILAQGNYYHRNKAANEWGADLYLEFHLNAGGGNYSMVLFDERGGQKRKDQALALAIAMKEALGTGGF